MYPVSIQKDTYSSEKTEGGERMCRREVIKYPERKHTGKLQVDKRECDVVIHMEMR